MYTETEFMDMSLQSRLDKLRSEVMRMIEWKSTANISKVTDRLFYLKIDYLNAI